MVSHIFILTQDLNNLILDALESNCNGHYIKTDRERLRADVSKNQTLGGNSQKIDFAHTFKFHTLSC